MMRSKGRPLSSGGAVFSFPIFSLIIRGLLVALGFSILLLAINASLIYFSPLSETFVPYLLFAGALLSILLGAVFVGKRTEEKGWLLGGVMGLCYVLALFCLGLLLRVEPPLGSGLITKLFLGFSFGAAGGILGINS